MKNPNVNIEELSKNLSETEREQLIKLIEKANKPEPLSKVFRPEQGEHYLYLTAKGDVDLYAYLNDNVDKSMLELGNVYRTKEEAERAVARQKAETKYINFLRDNEPKDWVPAANNNKFYLVTCIISEKGKVTNLQEVATCNYVRVKREFLSDEATIKKAKNTPEIAEAWILAMGYDIPLATE